MNDPHRIAVYLRSVVGEIAEAKGDVDNDEVDHTTAKLLDAVMYRLRNLANELDSADV